MGWQWGSVTGHAAQLILTHDHHRTVETEHLHLRPVIEEDADSVWLLHSDARTNRYNPAGPMTDRSQAEEQAREWAANWVADEHGYWALEESHVPGVVIGFGGIRATN